MVAPLWRGGFYLGFGCFAWCLFVMLIVLFFGLLLRDDLGSARLRCGWVLWVS